MSELAQVILPDLPKWVLYFSFIASAVLTLLNVRSFFKQPALDLKLTPELFFRLSDLGECLFCNPIYMAWNGPVLILDADAHLEKLGQNAKKCRFRIAQFGEKMKGGSNANPEFYFHSLSPIQHVDEGKPQRVLYMLVEEAQEQKVRSAFLQLTVEGRKIADRAREKFPQPFTNEEQKQSAVNWIVAEQEKLISQAITQIMDCVQLESGEYKFSVAVTYTNPKSRYLRPRGRFLKWLLCRTARGHVTFAVDVSIKDSYRTQLKTCLAVHMTNILAAKSDAYIFPSYTPSLIVSI